MTTTEAKASCILSTEVIPHFTKIYKPNKMKIVNFSVNMHDENGIPFMIGVFIHIGKDVILKFNDMKDFEDTIEELQKCAKEIRENIKPQTK